MNAKLEDWSLVLTPGDWACTPELSRQCLSGVVSGHPKKSDGKRITTSAITGSDGELILTSSGTRYELGSPSEDYEKNFPNARERLMDSLKEQV